MEVKKCKCGGKGILYNGLSAYDGYYEVRCRECKRQTAKHVRAEDAVKDWNYMVSEKEQREEYTNTEEE